jgi:hypothetical protein
MQHTNSIHVERKNHRRVAISFDETLYNAFSKSKHDQIIEANRQINRQKTKITEVNMNAKIELRLGKVWPVTKQPLNARKPHESKVPIYRFAGQSHRCKYLVTHHFRVLAHTANLDVMDNWITHKKLWHLSYDV